MAKSQELRSKFARLVLVCLAGAVIAMGIVIPVLRFRENMLKDQSAASLGQIYAACIAYSNANSGQFPDSFATMIRTTGYPAIILTSPITSDTPYTGSTAAITDAGLIGHCSFVYCGKGVSTSSAASEVVAYEPLSNFGGKGMNVLYADKSVRWLERSETNRSYGN